MKQSLSEVLKTKLFTLEESLRLVVAVAEALEPLHEKEQIHGCVSVKSIGFDENGVIELKFNLVDHDSITEPHYQDTLDPQLAVSIPPEVWQFGFWSKGADVYGLGSILYHLVTENPIFQGNVARDIIALAKYSELVSPLSYNRAIPLWLNSLILRMLSPDPSQRIASAKEVKDLIKDRLRDLSHSIRTVTPIRSTIDRSGTPKHTKNSFGFSNLTEDVRNSVVNILSSSAAAFCIAFISMLIAYGILDSLPQFYSLFLVLAFPHYYLMLMVPLIGFLPLISTPCCFLGIFGRVGRDILLSWMAMVCFLFVFIVLLHIKDVVWLHYFSSIDLGQLNQFDIVVLARYTLLSLIHIVALSPTTVEYQWKYEDALSIVPDLHSTVPIPSLYPVELLLFALGLNAILKINRSWTNPVIPIIILAPVMLEAIIFILIKITPLQEAIPTMVDVTVVNGVKIYYSYYGLLLGAANHLLILAGMAFLTFFGDNQSSSTVT